MNKFTYGVFTGDYPVAVSKELYSKEEAIEIAKSELQTDNVSFTDGYVYHGFGVDWDDPCARTRSSWWICYHKPKNGCPVWLFKKKESIIRSSPFRILSEDDAKRARVAFSLYFDKNYKDNNCGKEKNNE